MFQLLGTAVIILLYLCTCSTKFYINNAFPYISGLPEDGLCGPKHVGEITAIAENCHLLVYYAASSGNSFPTFRDNLSALIFKGQESKKDFPSWILDP